MALYFSLLTYYSKAKIYMAFIGLICYILQSVFINYTEILAYKWTTLIYGVCVLFWSILFAEFWKRREALFALKYGQDRDEVYSK